MLYHQLKIFDAILTSVQTRILFTYFRETEKASINSSNIVAHKNDVNIFKENIFIIKGS